MQKKEKKNKSKKNAIFIEVQKRNRPSELRGESTREIKGFSRLKIRKISPEEFSKKDSRLEEDVEEEPEFDSEQFREFIRAPSFEPETPVLKKTANIQESINLEQNLETVSAPATKKEDDAIKYKMISEDYEAMAQQTRKMQDRDFVMRTPINPARLEEQRINLTRMQEQSFQMNPELHEIRRHSEGNLEKDYVTNVKGELKEKKTHSPFEQQEKKYEIR